MIINRVGILANAGKPAALAAARTAEAYLQERGIEVRLQERIAKSQGGEERGLTEPSLAGSDAVLVLGGDGTILAASREYAALGTPLLPVHLGRFGFLTEVAPENLKTAIDRLLDGDFTIEERIMVTGSAAHRRACQPEEPADGIDTCFTPPVTASVYALNEIVVANGSLSRVLHLRLLINGRYVTTYAADGIIVSTPTGSTAYSLSAGGPLVHPALQTLLVTPVCPHTLTARALLVPPDHQIAIELENESDDNVRVTVDGQFGFPLGAGDRVTISTSPYPARIISVGGANFYDKLQTKLRWGDRVVY